MRQIEKPSALTRLNKILAQSGVCSRRRADELIQAGNVSVNGAVVTQLGYRADQSKDAISVNGVLLNREQKVYILLHKPTGYITTVRDAHAEKTVFDLLPSLTVRLFPVGRLDKETSGLLLLTNDGDLSYQLTHPKFGVEREYQVRVRGRVNASTRQRIDRGGIPLDEYVSAPCVIARCVPGQDHTDFELIIREGRNREVRRICRAVNHPVITLQRVRFGNLRLGDLAPGSWKNLRRQDIHLNSARSRAR